MFVSHARGDSPAVPRLFSALSCAAAPLWNAENSAELWSRETLDQIEQCDVIVVALSERWIAAPVCRVQAGFAAALGKPMLIVHLSGPDALADALSDDAVRVNWRGPVRSDDEIRCAIDALVAETRPAVATAELVARSPAGPESEDIQRDTRPARRRRVLLTLGALAAVGVLGVAAVVGYRVLWPKPTATQPLVTAEQLIHVLASPSELDSLMGVGALRGDYFGSDLDEARLMPDAPDCVGVATDGVALAYRQYDYAEVLDQSLVAGKPGQPLDAIVSQTLVRFDSADQARRVLTDAEPLWDGCAGRTITEIDFDDEMNWVVGDQVTRSEARIAVTLTQEDGSGWKCQHVLQAQSNVVLDAEACGSAIDHQAESLADAVAVRMRGLAGADSGGAPTDDDIWSVLLSRERLESAAGQPLDDDGWNDRPDMNTPWVSAPQCASVVDPASWALYADSDFVEVANEKWVSDDSDVRVFQGAVRFTSDSAAKSVLDGAVDAWEGCHGDVSVLYDAEDEQHWRIDVPVRSGDTMSSRAARLDYDGWICEHTIGRTADVIVEARVCGRSIGGIAAAISNELADNAAG